MKGYFLKFLIDNNAFFIYNIKKAIVERVFYKQNKYQGELK